ncbi:MAG: flippase [Candidatus Buchananbacteria bacterium]
MSLVKQIANNTLIQVTGRLISVGLGLIVLSLMAHSLGPIGFGYLTTIMAFLQFFCTLADLGLNLTTLQLISEPEANQSKIISNLLTFRSLTAIILLSLAPAVAWFFPYPNLVKWGITLMSFSFLFAVIQQIFVGLFQKELQTIKNVLADLGGRIVSLLIMLITWQLGWGLWGAIAALIFSNLVNLIILILSAKKIIHLGWDFDLTLWKKIITYSWPLAATTIFNLIYFKADTIILSLYQPATAVGLYGAPYKILEVLINFPFLFLGLILPILTTNWLKQDLIYFKKIFQTAFDFLIIVTVPIIFGCWVLAKPIILLIAGEAFLASAGILKVLIVATGIIFISSLFGYVIIAVNQQRKMIKFYFATAVISLLGYFLLIPRYSYWGAAYMTVLAELLIALTAGWMVYRLTKLQPDWQIFIKALLASLIMAGSLWPLANLNILLTVALGLLIYLVALYALGGINPELIKQLSWSKPKTKPQITN